MSRISALIVGAGPTGLMMACELARHGIQVRIIDKKHEPTTGSYATWIQSRTLEILDGMDLANSFLKIGHKCHAINFYDHGKYLANMLFSEIDSAYPFILMLPQRETERLLNKKLEESKIQVERSYELINIEQTSDGVVSTIKLSDGDIETITSDWVIACDGANSTIRNKCQIAFPGENIPEQFMVADAEMSSSLPADEIHVFFDKGKILPDKATIFSAFPWGSKQYRLSANLYQGSPRQTFHAHEVKEVVAERTYGNFIVENVSWISPFWIHGKSVDNMRHNAIFLLGDAAHIHSPAGGQGMNTGIQDAYNLAWKLALVIKNKANRTILESFQAERHPIIEEVVKKTNSLTNMMLFDKKFFHELHEFGKTLAKKEKAKEISKEVMQLAISYKNSPIIDYSVNVAEEAPRQGERAPDVSINKQQNLYPLFSNRHNILLFTGKENSLSENFIGFLKELTAKFSDHAKIFVIAKENIQEDNVIIDTDYHIHDKYQIKNTAIYIIRPDTYIGYFSEELNVKSIELFFDKITKK